VILVWAYVAGAIGYLASRVVYVAQEPGQLANLLNTVDALPLPRWVGRTIVVGMLVLMSAGWPVSVAFQFLGRGKRNGTRGENE